MAHIAEKVGCHQSARGGIGSQALVAFKREEFVPDFLTGMLIVLAPSVLMIAWFLWRSRAN